MGIRNTDITMVTVENGEATETVASLSEVLSLLKQVSRITVHTVIGAFQVSAQDARESLESHRDCIDRVALWRYAGRKGDALKIHSQTSAQIVGFEKEDELGKSS